MRQWCTGASRSKPAAMKRAPRTQSSYLARLSMTVVPPRCTKRGSTRSEERRGALPISVVYWRIAQQAGRDEARPADAIVVFGAAEYDGRPSPVYKARLDQIGRAAWSSSDLSGVLAHRAASRPR